MKVDVLEVRAGEQPASRQGYFGMSVDYSPWCPESGMERSTTLWANGPRFIEDLKLLWH